MTLGYDGTLCSLSVWRPDQLLVPKERLTRPHAKVFADPPLTEGTNLVDKSKLLDSFIEADDIDWKDNSFRTRRTEEYRQTNYREFEFSVAPGTAEGPV